MEQCRKKVTEESNASNCRALEGGYMNTSGTTYIRNSSFYVTDAISCESFVSQPRFHNNLYIGYELCKRKWIKCTESCRSGRIDAISVRI